MAFSLVNVAVLGTDPARSFISESPLVAKIQYYMKICFVFILILFIDSVNRVYRVQIELIAASENAKSGSYVILSHSSPV
jgi:hypothetical protein